MTVMRPLPEAHQSAPDTRRRLKRKRPVVAAPQKPRPRILPDPQDREFLPAALAIIESPPSPIRIWLMLTICAFAAGSLAWAFFGEIDIIATALGKVEASGHSKIIQPLETGKVLELNVANGKMVKAGDVLIRLDPREAAADLAAARATETAAEAEAIRRGEAIRSARDLAHAGDGPVAITTDGPGIAWPESISQSTRAREEGVLASDLTELRATLDNLADQEREKQAAVTQLAASIEADRHLKEIQDDRVAVRQSLYEKSAGSRIDLIDAIQTLRTTDAQIAGDIGHKIQAEAALATIRSERRRTIETFLSDQTRKAADARRTAEEKRAERQKAEARLDHMTLTAPIDGVVTSLAVTTLGQVVTSGQEVLALVPTAGGRACAGRAAAGVLQPTPDTHCDLAIEIEAYVSNDDIGFVTPGEEAVIKIDSFPYTRYGTIAGHVASVARDAIPADQANLVLTDPTRAGDPASHALTPSARPLTDLVFEARIVPEVAAIPINGRPVPLTPGMTVKVEIRTGSRRIIDYVFSPLVEVMGTAMRER